MRIRILKFKIVAATFRLRKTMTEERLHRLPRECYKGRVAVAFTLCLRERERFFVNKEIFKLVEERLLQTLNNFGCDAHVYLFMPDHCHFLFEGKTDFSDIYQCLINFKQKSSYYLKIMWQKDFYDHILRNDEDVIKQTRYILGNPIRKNLVQNWKEYPFKGSTVYDFDGWDIAPT